MTGMNAVSPMQRQQRQHATRVERMCINEFCDEIKQTNSRQTNRLREDEHQRRFQAKRDMPIDFAIELLEKCKDESDKQ